MKKTSHRQYLRTLALVLAGAVSVVVALVLVVDPYSLYGLVKREHFNAVKPSLTRFQAEIKLAQVLRAPPQFIILGNSRAEMGFDPRSRAFGPLAGSGYNLAIPGSGLDMSVRQFGALQQAGVRPRLVIMGVEFVESLKRVASLPKDALEAPEQAPPTWRFDALFSLASLADAMRTVRAQHHAEASVMTAAGFNPAHDNLAQALRDTYYTQFKLRALNSATNFQRLSKTDFIDGYFQSLRALLMDMAASGADVRLVIYPYHAQMLTLFEGTGLWPLFDAWKAGMVREVAAVRQRYPAARISLTDFSGFGAYTCETIPGKHQLDMVPRWYWEAGHFKQALGEIVLQRVMAQADGTPQDSAFGTSLTSATLAANRARIAAERNACLLAQPQMFTNSSALIAQLGRR